MNGLRVEIDLDKISHNTAELVRRCHGRGMSVTAVTKAMLGAPELVTALDAADDLGDSRIENIERMRDSASTAPMLLLRSPMLSQIRRVVRSATMSANTEQDVLTALSTAAREAGVIHDVMLMVELGDLREGIMPGSLHDLVRHVLSLRDLRLQGIGTNLACRNGIEPTDENMHELSAMVDDVEATFDIEIPIVSGGNSANLAWALGPGGNGRVNNLRLGESILLGREPLHRQPIDGLHTDTVTLVAEVIECNRKPTVPWGRSGQNSFGETPETADRGEVWQTILAVGRQDTDTTDLTAPAGLEILAASSDHLVTATDRRMTPGDELRFQPGYAALLRAMTSPFVEKAFGPTETVSEATPDQ